MSSIHNRKDNSEKTAIKYSKESSHKIFKVYNYKQWNLNVILIKIINDIKFDNKNSNSIVKM